GRHHWPPDHSQSRLPSRIRPQEPHTPQLDSKFRIPAGKDNLRGACVPDQWKFDQGQCTSWVAYRLNELNELNGISFTETYRGQSWGNASTWDTAAKNLKIAVNGTPAIGAVAWWAAAKSNGYQGHVAYVEQVNSPTSVVISEMNYDNDNGFRVRTITTSSGWPTDFIHIADR
ncbi:MAG: CHAP domain-containing protein, partial [Streptosporangiaceae bacterium]